MVVRYTHFESDDGAPVVADGHRVMYLGTGHSGGAAADARPAGDSAAEWVVVSAEWCGAGLFFALSGLCRLVFRGVIVVAASLVLPLVHELACIAGAVILYPLGAAGRCLATAVEQAGHALSQRSLALGIGRRLLGVFGQAVRKEPRVAPLMASTRVDTSRSAALAVRGDDA